MRTCWKQARPFQEISNALKKKYTNSVQVTVASNHVKRHKDKFQLTRKLSRRRLSSKQAEKKKNHQELQTTTVEPSFEVGPKNLHSEKDKIPITKVTRRKHMPDDEVSIKKDKNKLQTKVLKLKPPSRGHMVYMDQSPNYCNASPYSMGTKGRYCKDKESCKVLCCGRGYNIIERTVSKACRCKVIWCCEVKCDTCQMLVDVYLCK